MLEFVIETSVFKSMYMNYEAYQTWKVDFGNICNMNYGDQIFLTKICNQSISKLGQFIFVFNRANKCYINSQ